MAREIFYDHSHTHTRTYNRQWTWMRWASKWFTAHTKKITFSFFCYLRKSGKVSGREDDERERNFHLELKWAYLGVENETRQRFFYSWCWEIEIFFNKQEKCYILHSFFYQPFAILWKCDLFVFFQHSQQKTCFFFFFPSG